MFTTQFAPSPVARMSKDEFEAIGNTFIVRKKGRYHYFPVKVSKHAPNEPTPILRFEKLPPVIMEGWVVTQNRIYLVSIQDLLRGVVRTSNEYKMVKKDEPVDSSNVQPAAANSSNAELSGEGEQTPGIAQTAETPRSVEDAAPIGNLLAILEPGAVDALGVEGYEAVNRAFDQQVEALYDSEDS